MLILDVLPSGTSNVEAAICEGENYQYNGQILTTTGVYNFTVTGSNGCNATVILTLSVLPAANSMQQASICEGETYFFNGQMLSTAGTFSANLTAANGCDSMAILTLEVKPLPVTDFTSTVNGSEVSFINKSANAISVLWDFGDNTTSTEAHPVHQYAANGSYTVTLTATNGCGAFSVQKVVNVSVSAVGDLQGQTDILVFPNPNRGAFSVKLLESTGDEVEFSLFDAMGRLVRETKKDSAGMLLLDFSGTDAGVYLLE